MTDLDALLDFADQHRTAALIAGGAVVGLLLLLARAARHQRGRSAALTFAASVIALGFSAEGMWEVATGALHLAKWQAVLLFTFAEILMLFEADRARQKIAGKRDPRRHIRAVWVIALVAGLAAASHADNLSGQVIRLFMPLAVAWQWSSRIRDDLPEVARQESSWIWTPRRVGVELGLLKPGAADDLSEVFRRRNVDRMVRLARLIETGSERMTARREAALRRLAEGATAQMLAEVRERHQRGATVRAAIFDAPVQPASPPVQVEPVQVVHTPPVRTETKRSTPKRKPVRSTRSTSQQEPPPRVVAMVDQLWVDYPADQPGPVSVNSVVNRYRWRKADATEAVRIYRAQRDAQTGPVHIPDSPADLDRMAVLATTKES